MTESSPTDRRVAFSTAALVFGLTAPMTYLCERFYERLRSGRNVPQLIVSEAHANFYWRAALALWFGGLVAILAFRMVLAESAEPARRATWLTRALLLLFPLSIAWAYRFP